MGKESQIKEYIENKEKNALTSVIEEFTWELKFLKFFKNDKDLQEYAELSLKPDNELTLKDSLKMAKLEMLLPIKCQYFEEFKKFLEDLKQNWWSESQSENTSWESSEWGADSSQNPGTETPSEWNADSSQDSSTETASQWDTDSNQDSSTEATPQWNTDSSQDSSTEISSEIEDASVEEIAHLWSEWQNRKKWEKLRVDKQKRKKFLFPDGEPKNAAEMESKYLSTVSVEIIDKNWNEKDLTLKVHKKLAKNYEAIFKELKENWIKIDSSSTAAYNWRKIRRWNRLSDHSFWTAIDVNWSDNWWVYWPTNEDSIFFNNQTTVEIFKKYWFARWWDWSAKSNDPMHFTYFWW